DQRRSLAVGGIAGSEALFKKHAFRLFSVRLLAPVLAAAEPANEEIGPMRRALETLGSACEKPFTNIDQTSLQQLSEIYRRHRFQALWTSYTQLDELLGQLDALVDDGLNPAIYQPEAIRRAMQTATAEPLHRECSDMLATHAYLLALRHLAHGRLPQDRLEPV